MGECDPAARMMGSDTPRSRTLKAFAIGLVLAVVVLAVGFLTPRFLPTAAGPATLGALQDAELARRQLHAYDLSLPLVDARSNLEQLKQADFEALVEQAREDFDRLGTESRDRVNAAKRSDQANSMPPTDARAATMNASGVKSAVSRFEGALRENQKLLADAAKNAQSASRADRNALGVGQVAGSIKLVEAARTLTEARHLRARLISERTQLVAIAAEWAGVRARRDYHAGLEVDQIRSDLDADLEEIGTALADTQSEVEQLTAEVAEREQILAGLRAELDEARSQRLNMEELGFTVGDDASFNAYRDQYLGIAERLQTLEQREQMLAFGGIEGGTVTEAELGVGPIEGGETILGLDELKRRLAVAEDKLARFTRGRRALEDHVNLVGAVGSEADAQEQRYAARLQELVTEADRIRNAMAETAQQAFEKEDAALRAARDAATAFREAKSAADRWQNDARNLQRDKDPQRTNERLKRIGNDKFVTEAPSSSEAQAKTLVGRILTERALALAGYLDALGRVKELMPGVELDTGTLQESYTTAHDEAISVLGEAREVYERLAQNPADPDTGWVHQSALATVYHLLAQIDDFNAAQHRSNAIEQLGNALQRRRESPFLQTQLVLHSYLTGGAEPAPNSPDEGAAEPEAPADTAADEGE